MKKTYIKPATSKVEIDLKGSVLDTIGIDTNSYHKSEYSGEDTTGDAKRATWEDFSSFELWQDNTTPTVWGDYEQNYIEEF